LPLLVCPKGILRDANEQIARLRRDEESKWAQRAKVKHIQEGGQNTKYFHLIANGKHRKKKIFQLEQDEGTIVGEENLKLYITKYYKKLFGSPEPNTFTLMENITHDIPQLTLEENNILTAVKDATFQMEHNKAPRPDGFSAEFYQTFWDVIKTLLMEMFAQLSTVELPLFKLNFGVITLLPKKENAVQIQQYRPICLLNVNFKISPRLLLIALLRLPIR